MSWCYRKPSCWGRAGLAGDGGLLWVPSQQQGSPLLISSHPLALHAGSGKRPQLSILSPLLPPFPCLLTKWTDPLSIWEQTPSLWQHWGTPIHPFLMLPSFSVLLAALSSGLTAPPQLTHQSVFLSLPESQLGFLGSFQEAILWL